MTFCIEHTSAKSFYGSDKTLKAKSVVVSNTIRVNLLFRVSHDSTILYRLSLDSTQTEISVKVRSYSCVGERS